MIILDNIWLFIHIPKTSGKNFKKMISENYKKPFKKYDINVNENTIVCPNLKNIYWENYNQKFLNLHGINFDSRLIDKYAPQHSSVFMLERAGIYNKIKHKVITIVRNPYTRLISLYYNVLRLCANNNIIIPSLEYILFSSNSKDIIPIFGFSNFQRTQLDYLKDIKGNIVCQKFYKMETDQEKIKKDFELDCKQNTNYHITQSSRDYSLIYTDKLIDYVQTTFKQDFEYFDYDINPFW